MEPLYERPERRPRPSRARLIWLMGTAVVLAAAAYAAGMGEKWGLRPKVTPDSPGTTAAISAPARPEPEAFHMADLDNGWMLYPDRLLITGDGGETWLEAPAGVEPSASPSADEQPVIVQPVLTTAAADGKTYPVKQSQFVTPKLGWALVGDAAELPQPILVTADGGATWHSRFTPELREAMQQEKRRLELTAMERALYASPDAALRMMEASWSLLPAAASPGDVVLIRSRESGELQWQGRTYKLQPYGDGFFTYLPVPMQTKPGRYPVGDAELTIKAKTFDTQHLQVTKQMESMKQDTQRIQADQKRIDQARSVSRPEFVPGSAPFVQPIEGILTTPFGHTRYVNGKYDSSHMAIDLAAKEGTPIQATNDGVVALADSLYLTGNTIYLDHGMGLFSQYAHLSELRVKTGDSVKRGDIIGLVGTTGFSTGPHLHFAFWAHNIPVNPNLFFQTTPFHWGTPAAPTKTE
ncbi:hypothetical protein J31TS4_09630 [Paenibacillus sp. J31TS4]|uniref:M23 family metallopeptidase n=1 Tax=Paenibacillus sp. J31TS4 TaxID=2807195 RepID=UPI001B018B7D|nr:M23 family metallopeptidase [Paenibacillus sp. J31TS4]GIP37683.1 hypothetical protein J31TS4_09630 [Paenibacillus sp. J31TS4]